jgi:hypothetical protein
VISRLTGRTEVVLDGETTFVGTLHELLNGLGVSEDPESCYQESLNEETADCKDGMRHTQLMLECSHPHSLPLFVSPPAHPQPCMSLIGIGLISPIYSQCSILAPNYVYEEDCYLDSSRDESQSSCDGDFDMRWRGCYWNVHSEQDSSDIK